MTSSNEQVNSNIAYSLQQYDDKKDSMTIMTITYSDRKVVREISLDQHKTHAHPTVEIDKPSSEAYYTLLRPLYIFLNLKIENFY
jgi:hypothetical protein